MPEFTGTTGSARPLMGLAGSTFRSQGLTDAFSPWPAREWLRRGKRPQRIAKTLGNKKSNRLFKEIVSWFTYKTDRETLKLCEGMSLKGWGNIRGLLWVLAAMVLLGGCSGVLLEQYNREGQMDRIKIDTLDWKKFDAKRRSPSDARGIDDLSIMLKSEKTF